MSFRRLALLAALTTLGAGAGSPAAAQSPAGLTPVGTDFASPVHVTAPPGDERRLMVVEQGGTVRVMRDGVKLATPFLTLSGDLLAGGERGLLSIAFAPDYQASGLLYAYYTDGQGDIRVDELRRAADSADRVEPGYRRLVIEVPHTEAGNHNGGQVSFGPDGYLYLATGDGGNGYDEPTRDARDLSSLLGKVLRIAPIPGGGYAAPGDNPYFGPGTPGSDEVFSYGLRNPFRFSFDRLTGDLFIGDVGQSKVEEINYAPWMPGVGAGRGLNFGWDDCEGSFQAEPSPTGETPCPLVGDTRAVVEHLRPGSGFCSITGGYVVRDPGLEALYGRYLYGDLCYGSLRSFSPSAPTGDRAETGLAVNSLVSLGEDACGRLHTVEHGGTVSRIEDSTPSGCGPAGAGAGGSGAPNVPRSLAISVSAARAQRALRRGGVLVRVGCDQACGIRALGRLSLRRGGRPRRLRQTVRRLASGGSVRLKLRLTRNGRVAVRRALRRGRRVTATVTIRARGADRVLRVRRLRVRLVR